MFLKQIPFSERKVGSISHHCFDVMRNMLIFLIVQYFLAKNITRKVHFPDECILRRFLVKTLEFRAESTDQNFERDEDAIHPLAHCSFEEKLLPTNADPSEVFRVYSIQERKNRGGLA